MSIKKRRRRMFVTLVLDETGSMDHVRDQTIGAVNEYYDTLRESGELYAVTQVQFNSVRTHMPIENSNIESVPKITRENYVPDHATPLYDAMGFAMIKTDQAIKGRRKPPVLFVVMTDGLNNASKEYTLQQINDMREGREQRGNWTFVYLAANQDEFEVGRDLGFKPGNIKGYAAENTASAMRGLAIASVAYSRTSSAIGDLNTAQFWNTEDDEEKEDETSGSPEPSR
jgi:hypothetical protein